MSNDNSRMLYNQFRTAQDKYVYFLLAVAASAIAFSTQITKELVFSYTLIPLGLAVLAWALSFFSGCRTIQYVNSNTFANFELLKVEAGTHQEYCSNPRLMQAAREGIREGMTFNQKKSGSYGVWQFRLIVIGGISFVFWHLLEMGARTIGN
jgi:hypothetical protein